MLVGGLMECPFKVRNIDKGRYSDVAIYECSMQYNGMGYNECVGEGKCPIMNFRKVQSKDDEDLTQEGFDKRHRTPFPEKNEKLKENQREMSEGLKTLKDITVHCEVEPADIRQELREFAREWARYVETFDCGGRKYSDLEGFDKDIDFHYYHRELLVEWIMLFFGLEWDDVYGGDD